MSVTGSSGRKDDALEKVPRISYHIMRSRTSKYLFQISQLVTMHCRQAIPKSQHGNDYYEHFLISLHITMQQFHTDKTKMNEHSYILH